MACAGEVRSDMDKVMRSIRQRLRWRQMHAPVAVDDATCEWNPDGPWGSVVSSSFTLSRPNRSDRFSDIPEKKLPHWRRAAFGRTGECPPAGGRENEPVGPHHRRTAGSSPEDGEFVPKHDDFQVLEIVRPKAQGRKLRDPPKHYVTEREEHETSSVARPPPYSRRQALGGERLPVGPISPETKPGFLHPSRQHDTGCLHRVHAVPILNACSIRFGGFRRLSTTLFASALGLPARVSMKPPSMP